MNASDSTLTRIRDKVGIYELRFILRRLASDHNLRTIAEDSRLTLWEVRLLDQFFREAHLLAYPEVVYRRASLRRAG